MSPRIRNRSMFGCLMIFSLACLQGVVAAQSLEQSENFTIDKLLEGEAEPTLQPQTAAKIIERVNRVRQSEGLKALKPDERLNAAARYFAKYLARNQKFEHQADQHTPAERAEEHGYAYCIVLENLAFEYTPTESGGQDPAARFVEGWRESKEHHENLFDPDVTETGVAVAEGDEGRFAVQLFGRPRSQRIELRITNQSDETVTYELSARGFAKEFELEPRTGRIHHVCRPPTLKLKDDANQKTYEYLAGAELIFRQNDAGKFVVERTAEESRDRP